MVSIMIINRRCNSSWRIVMVTPYWFPIIGGVTSYVSNLVKTLKSNKNGFSVELIGSMGESDSDACILSNNILSFILKAFLLLCKERPSVIHSHDLWYVLLPCVLYKKIHPDVSLIFTFHTFSLKPLIGLKLGLKKRIFEYLLSNCDWVTFVSFNLMNEIGKRLHFISDKKVIYAAPSTKKISEKQNKQFKEDFSLKNTELIISFIGPLVVSKKVEGVKILIEAIKIISVRYTNAKLLIVGDGAYRKELEQLVEKQNIEENVVFTGFIDNVFIPLAITDIYTHISLQEGFPLALLEAMSVGKPVIASITGGIPEIIVDNENGILVGEDPEVIANAIINLYEDEEKMNMLGEQAKKTIEEKYTWNKIANEYEKLYLE